jgi:acyl phosphate:glycerol-3-phosphate acyltransferase
VTDALRLLLGGNLGYLAGTLPSADVAGRLVAATSGRRVDLRTAGSANPGALNAAQQLGASWGIAVLVADAGKGVLGASLGRRLAGASGAYVAATAAIAGHIFPVWTGFRGGKGVATSAGACLAVFPAYFPIDAAVAGLSAAGTRNPETATRISSALWVISAVVWWRRRWPNLWGPPPTAGLPMFAATSAAMILGKFAAARRGAMVVR